MLTKQQINPYIWDKSIKIKTKEGKYESEENWQECQKSSMKEETMYEVLVKLENELEKKKYTIEELEELKELLEGMKTEEVEVKKK